VWREQRNTETSEPTARTKLQHCASRHEVRAGERASARKKDAGQRWHLWGNKKGEGREKSQGLH